jgi:transcriptional regulator
MYLPAHFAESRRDVLEAFVLAHPFGLLLTQGGSGRLEADGVPFMLDPDPAGGPGILRAHVARANPVWHSARADAGSLVVFQGPHAYVSPGWYASKAEHGKVVPTWDYIVVHGRGRVRAIEDPAWLRAFVTRLTDRHEATRRAPWAVTDAPADFVATMLGAIVGIEIVLSSLTGKWKVSQNRSSADRAGVGQGLVADSAGTVQGSDRRELAAAVLGHTRAT